MNKYEVKIRCGICNKLLHKEVRYSNKEYSASFLKRVDFNFLNDMYECKIKHRKKETQ
jgi:hypothetical protein